MSEINVQLKDGAPVAVRGSTTVAEALKKLDRDLAKQALAARVNGQEVDLAYTIPAPENGDAVKIEPVLPQTREGLEVLRHSTAHLLAAAVLDLFPGTKLGIGPALLDDPRYGFFYDVITPRVLTEADLPVIEKKMRDIAKRNMSYRRDEITKAEALRIFNERDEPLKRELIDEKAGETVSVYYIDGSPFIDFCLGPHVPNTNRLRAFKLLSLAGAYWKGDAERPQMQRIYGTAFFTQEELDAWLKQRAEAEKRDHRRLGRELDLFSIQEQYGQGLVFWHPKGGIVRQQMDDYLRAELVKRNYSFVYTPHIARRELWQLSGHEQNYGDSMFAPTKLEETEFRLKPMNCPMHIGIYKSQQRSYRDLPQRYAEMGTVYRAELSGTLHGLMRVRGFTVDDAHLFCTPEQIPREIDDCVDFAYQVLKTFGFDKIKFELSVKGSDTNKLFLGSDEEWEKAERALSFFSSRRRHTRCSRDWSSDVCSSDVRRAIVRRIGDGHRRLRRRLVDRDRASALRAVVVVVSAGEDRPRLIRPRVHGRRRARPVARRRDPGIVQGRAPPDRHATDAGHRYARGMRVAVVREGAAGHAHRRRRLRDRQLPVDEREGVVPCRQAPQRRHERIRAARHRARRRRGRRRTRTPRHARRRLGLARAG